MTQTHFPNSQPTYRPVALFTLLFTFLTACLPGIESTPTPMTTDPGPDECFQRVLVTVWGDTNADGIQDDNEPPLENVLLMIAPLNSPEDGIQLSTAANGNAHFPTRELADCDPSGYQVLFLRQVSGYAFPEDPVVDLAEFDPLRDRVPFGLIPEGDDP